MLRHCTPVRRANIQRCICSDTSLLSACFAERLRAVRNAVCPDQMQQSRSMHSHDLPVLASRDQPLLISLDVVTLPPRSGPLPTLTQLKQPHMQARCCWPMSYGAWAGATRCLCTDCWHTSTCNTVQPTFVAAKNGTAEHGIVDCMMLVKVSHIERAGSNDCF